MISWQLCGMPNILFSYIYRDGANYKNFNEVVFANPHNLPLEQIKAVIEDNLIDGEWFYAAKWNLPDLHFEKWDREVDHDYHEFQSVEITDQEATDLRTINGLLQQIGEPTAPYANTPYGISPNPSP